MAVETELRERRTTGNRTLMDNDQPLIKDRHGSGFTAHIKNEWDSILWLFAMFALLYYTEFASNLFFSDLVDKRWLCACLFCGAVCISSLLYLSCCKSYEVEIRTWDKYTAGLVLTTVLTVCLTGISFVMAVWRLWHIWSIAMLVVLFMGLISMTTLLKL